MRFLPPDDERIRRTVLAVADELTVDGLVLRYRPEETDDGLSGNEGTFTICSFWLVSALVEIGEPARPGGSAKSCFACEPARPVRRGDRYRHRPAHGQLPAGVHPPGADQRGDAPHPARDARQQRRAPLAGVDGSGPADGQNGKGAVAPGQAEVLPLPEVMTPEQRPFRFGLMIDTRQTTRQAC